MLSVANTHKSHKENVILKWRKKYMNGLLRRYIWVGSEYDLQKCQRATAVSARCASTEIPEKVPALLNASIVINRRYSRSKMSSVCHNFVQNAWKKDFCSNCFKGKEEHAKLTSENGKYLATPYQSRGSYFKISKSPHGILKITAKKKHKRSVTFPEDISRVIGYGGDDWSDGEEFEMSDDIDEIDTFPDTEDEKELHKITKTNTDFNTVKANLVGPANGETRKSYTSLLLGKMQTDSEGKKKTLMVSVTPFGQDCSTTKSVKTHERKSAVLTVTNASENISSGYKTNIILSSFAKNNDTVICSKYSKKETITECTEKSLLEEISETLEQNKFTSASELSKGSSNESTKPTVVDETMKEKVVSQDEVDKRETVEGKKNGIIRNLPIIKTQDRPKVVMNSRPEFKFCKISIEKDRSEIPQLSNSMASANSMDSANNSSTSDDDSCSGRTDSDNEDSGHFVETLNIMQRNEDALKINVFNDANGNRSSSESSLDDIRKVDGQVDTLQDQFDSTYQTKILDMPSIIPKMSNSDLFSVDASRELAGEPDGRADPDDVSEAPALPSSPIPNIVDPRPSFLHGMISDLQNIRPVIPEKPKLPVKPLSVLKQTNKRPQIVVPPQQQQMIIQLQQTLITNGLKRNSKDGPQEAEENTEPFEACEETFVEDCDSTGPPKSPISKQDSDNSSYNKRKAPMPPPSPSSEEITSKYQRNPTAALKSDSPVVREKEKRERASSCSPKGRPNVNNNPSGEPAPSQLETVPEPAPRRNISLSHDNLLLDEKRKGKYKFSIKKLLRIGSSKDIDKKEIHSVTVAKLSSKPDDNLYDLTPKPKPRLVIIHPLELNGSSVEVVKSNCEIGDTGRRLSHDDVSSIYSGSSSVQDLEIATTRPVTTKPPPPPRSHSLDGRSITDGCPVKPARPPPPKSAILQKQQKQPTWTNAPVSKASDNVYANLGEVRSAIAPRKPERTASMREREAQLELPKRRVPLPDDKDDLDDSSDDTLVEATNNPIIHNYDDVYNSEKYDNDSCTDENMFDSAKSSDSDYEYVNHARSSSPECDSSSNQKSVPDKIELRTKSGSRMETIRKSDVEANTEYTKYNNHSYTNKNNSSLTYCGSETESEIYSPYSFYSCTDNITEDPSCNDEYSNDVTSKTTTNKLRLRKGRSIVHKNLEDNYGAVVIANHEALAQVLDQVQQSALMQPSLRGLKACTNLRWSDFTLIQTPISCTNKNHSVKAGKRLFYPAVWNSNTLGAVNVTLMLHKEHMASQIVSQQSVQPQTLSLNAVTEFCDLVPLQQLGEEGEDLVQATVVVLARTQADTIKSFGDYLHTNSDTVDGKADYQMALSEKLHEATFMMLQLVNGLKCLQARGVEEIPDSLTSFIICRESQPMSNVQGSFVNLQTAAEDRLSSIQAPKTNSYGRVCILQGLSEDINCNKSAGDEHLCSLCECAITALQILLPNDKLAQLIKELLNKERAVSLNQVKSVLEFMLWGPLDVVQGVPLNERELSLQRWLDLERATVLHGLVRTRVQLNAFEQSHLLFLVRSSAKAMCDASVLLENANIY